MTDPRPGADPATSTADDMAAMRARWAETHGRSPDLPSDVAVLWAEVGRLRADLATARRERDEAREHLNNLVALHRALLLPTVESPAALSGRAADTEGRQG